MQARYIHNKFTVGGSIELIGPTKWTCIQDYSLFLPSTTLTTQTGVFKAPTALNFSLYGDYKVSKTFTLYGEVNNILGDAMHPYHWAFYREQGASFTVGIKVLF